MNILTLRKTYPVYTKYMRVCTHPHTHTHTHISTLPFPTPVLTLGSQLCFNSAKFSTKI